MSDGNVRVAVRVRPLCARERLAGSNEVISIGEDGRSVLAAPDRHFTFDSVLSPEVGQEAVFEELALPFVDSLLDGFNCTILAYGQTGSGKTYTMGSGLDGLCELTVGIIPRAVKYLMEKLYGMFAVDGSAESGGEFFELYVSFLELYNEDIADLLSPVDRSDRTKRPVLTIREDPLGGICIAGIKEERVRSSEEVLEYLQRGTLGRTTKSTDMNLVSSRSHAIFTLTLRQRRTICDEAGVPFLKNFVSKLHFVDLAGSERVSSIHLN
jgi:kinesin family protein 4/21/27